MARILLDQILLVQLRQLCPFREYSPGLVTSILMWVDSYFIVRYRPSQQVNYRSRILESHDYRPVRRSFSDVLFPLGEGTKNAVARWIIRWAEFAL